MEANVIITDGSGVEKGTVTNPIYVNDTEGTSDVPLFITERAPTVTASTGSATIAVSYQSSTTFWFTGVTMHLDSAPTSSEDFTITLDATAGATYDTVLFRRDLSVNSDTDIFYYLENPLACASGDAIDVDYPNTDTKTYGIRIVVKEL